MHRNILQNPNLRGFPTNLPGFWVSDSQTQHVPTDSSAIKMTKDYQRGQGSHSPHIRPYPKRGHIRPYPSILPIDCVIQPFTVRPGDKGLLGGTGEHLGGTWGRSLSHFPHH